jgi:NAD(P)-dependent dehydrogenase (short-subunit alcohol dehydrogenase family)
MATPSRGEVVIVGATGSMGSAIVEALVRRSVPVLAVARGAQALNDLVAAHGDTVRMCVADIADNSSIDVIKHSLTGPVRMAIFAAGLPVRGSVDTIDPDLFAIGANIKVGGMTRLVHAVRDRLEVDSRIVAIAGSLGLEPSGNEAGPGTVNAGLFNLMRQLSILYGPRGITTHTLCPGPIDSPRLHRIAATIAEERGVSFDEVWAEYVARNSLGRLPTLAEIAWAVTVLLDPEASVLHGAVIKLDAGGTRGLV